MIPKNTIAGLIVALAFPLSAVANDDEAASGNAPSVVDDDDASGIQFDQVCVKFADSGLDIEEQHSIANAISTIGKQVYLVKEDEDGDTQRDTRVALLHNDPPTQPHGVFNIRRIHVSKFNFHIMFFYFIY